VGDLRGPLAERHEPRLRQAVEQGLDLLWGGSLGNQLLDRDPASRVLDSLPEFRQAQEDVAHQALAIGRHCPHDGVGRLRDGRCDAATGTVSLDRERPSVALRPGLAQRMREQRQGTGLARHVAQDQLHKARLEAQPGHARGLGDGLLELFVGHGSEQDLIVCHRPRQL
jgi:hypothetical protein